MRRSFNRSISKDNWTEHRRGHVSGQYIGGGHVSGQYIGGVM